MARKTTLLQWRITDIAAGKDRIAVLAENNCFFILPLDYNKLEKNGNLQYVKKSDYSKITNLPSSKEDQFILWQSTNIRSTPQLIKAKEILNPQTINSLTGRFPIRSISTVNGKIAVLDSAGNLSVCDTENISGNADFSFSSVGAVDIAFINNEYILISQSAINNNSPFLSVNYKTGETVPISYPAQSGLTVYTGNSGNTYAEAAEQDRSESFTSVIELTVAIRRNGIPVKIFESQNEALYLSIAESEGRLAISANDGAFLFSDERVEFERTAGLPVKLLGCGNFFISQDNEGNIVWYNNKNGKVIAVFRFYAEQWVLLTDKKISGGFSFTAE
jgi:hypothetical protein